MSEQGQSRREFGKGLTALAAATLLPGPVLAQKEPAPQVKEALALTEYLQVRCKHLTREQIESIARGILTRQLQAESLRKVKLTNADEPDFIFEAEIEGVR